MHITSTFSNSKAVHPSTLKTCRSIVFVFSTGHRMTRYEGGLECFTNVNGRALSKRTGTKLIPAMRAAVVK